MAETADQDADAKFREAVWKFIERAEALTIAIKEYHGACEEHGAQWAWSRLTDNSRSVEASVIEVAALWARTKGGS